MEQTSGKSLALRESVMELFIEQKVDHENEVNPESWTQLKGSNEKGI